MAGTQRRVVAVGNITVDHIVRQGTSVCYSPGGILNLCKAWSEMRAGRITPVSRIGDDNYSRYILKPLNKLNLDKSHILCIPNAESRLYETDITNPRKPRIQRKQEAEKLRDTPPKDIRPILKDTSVLFYHSFATVFETPHFDRTLKTVEEAHRLGVPAGFDANIRQVSLKNLKSKCGYVHKFCRNLDLLKVNEGEAKAMMDPNIREQIEGVTLRENELPKVAGELMGSYKPKTVAITMGERGSFILTKDEELRLKAIAPKKFVNSLGAGDLWCAGYCMKHPWKLTGKEAGFLATLLGSLATEESSAYPYGLTREKIARRVRENSKEYNIDSANILEKLKP